MRLSEEKKREYVVMLEAEARHERDNVFYSAYPEQCLEKAKKWSEISQLIQEM